MTYPPSLTFNCYRLSSVKDPLAKTTEPHMMCGIKVGIDQPAQKIINVGDCMFDGLRHTKRLSEGWFSIIQSNTTTIESI